MDKGREKESEKVRERGVGVSEMEQRGGGVDN